MKRLTMSKTQLTKHCLYWLRDDADWAPDEPGLPAQEGTYVHAMIHAAGTGQRTPEPPAGFSAESIERCARLRESWVKWLDTWHNGELNHESAVAYDPERGVGRDIVAKFQRDYSQARPGEIPGTVDAWSIGDGKALHVIDWKTGQRTTPAAENLQLACGALALRGSLTGQVFVHLVYLEDDGSAPYVDTAELSEMDLDAARSVLPGSIIPDAPPLPGPHCAALYCPARGSCPAHVTALAELGALTPASIEAMVARSIATPADVARAWPLIGMAEDVIEAAKKKVRAIVEASGEGVPLLNGKSLRMVPMTRETFAKGRIPKEQADRVLEDLRAMGALSTSTSLSMKEVKS